MYVAAYFAAKDTVLLTVLAQAQKDPDFPYWIALDKHTFTGKDIIIYAGNEIDFSAHRGMLFAFYLEGETCSDMTESPYWQLPKDW